jgi:hypothetical protein
MNLLSVASAMLPLLDLVLFMESIELRPLLNYALKETLIESKAKTLAHDSINPMKSIILNLIKDLGDLLNRIGLFILETCRYYSPLVSKELSYEEIDYN